MTNPEAQVVLAPNAIVVCDTCDNVFYTHAGRANCPGCGGAAKFSLMTGVEEQAAPEDSSPDHSGSESGLSSPRTHPGPPAAAESDEGGPPQSQALGEPDSAAEPEPAVADVGAPPDPAVEGAETAASDA